MTDYTQLESALGYTFNNKKILIRALTLASFSTENNQVLECFGDAILGFIVSEKIFPLCKDEKEMTVLRQNLICDEALGNISIRLGIDKALIRGKGDVTNKKAIPSAYECIVAAIYLDGGMKNAKKFVLSTIDFNSRQQRLEDSKGKLQEMCQALGENLPEYSHIDIGTPISPQFRAQVLVRGKSFFGEASTVKLAEKQAAQKALNYFLV